MSLFLASLTFGVTIAIMLVGLIGTVVPILPGTVFIWLGVLFYAVVNQFQAIGPIAFAILTLIALVTGTADIWMRLLGAKVSGTSRRSVIYAFIGGIIGMFVFAFIGSFIGYALGIVLGEYQKHQDLQKALKSSVGGLASIGAAAIVQLSGGLLMLIIFIQQVFTFA